MSVTSRVSFVLVAFCLLVEQPVGQVVGWEYMYCFMTMQTASVVVKGHTISGSI